MPSERRTPAIHGAAASDEIEDRTTAPVKAPIAPGIAIRRTVCQWTLPKRLWEAPAMRVVPSSARWTDADAAAAVKPDFAFRFDALGKAA